MECSRIWQLREVSPNVTTSIEINKEKGKVMIQGKNAENMKITNRVRKKENNQGTRKFGI